MTKPSKINISSSSFRQNGIQVHHLETSKICCVEGNEGDLLFMLMFLTSRIKDILRAEVSPEKLLRILEKVINNEIIFFGGEDPKILLERCLERSINDNKPE